MTALYEKVKDLILDQIHEGEIKVGDRLPPEAKFASELGVSRSTVRLAFSDLEALGILSRKKRVGTEVISDAPRKRTFMNAYELGSVLKLGDDCRHVAHTSRVVNAGMNRQLDELASTVTKWLAVSGVLLLPGDDIPICVVNTYVVERFAAIHPLVFSRTEPIARLIEETYGDVIGRVHQIVSAVACDASQSDLLKTCPGDPALQMTSQFYNNNGELMHVSIAVFDPSRFQLSLDTTN